MPRAGQLRVEPGRRLSDRVALGVLTATFPRQLVDEVIEVTGRREQRNRLLPAHLTLYYVLAMTLFSSSGYEEVMRSLTEGLAWASDGREQYELPSQVAISKARTRLGPEPLAELFTQACVPLATPATPGAFYRQWRLVSMDGLPSSLRGRGADLETSLVGQLMRSGQTVMMATGESGDFDDLIWSALPGLHTIALSLSHVGGRPYGALYALYSGREVGHVELELLELMAGHASVALLTRMKNSRLIIMFPGRCHRCPA